MKKLDIFLKEIQIKERESYGIGTGMVSRVPPANTVEVEVDDESSDNEEFKKLPWSKTEKTKNNEKK